MHKMKFYILRQDQSIINRIKWTGIVKKLNEIIKYPGQELSFFNESRFIGTHSKVKHW